MVILLLILPVYIHKAVALAAEAGIYENFWRNLRISATESEFRDSSGGFGILAYVLPVSFIVNSISVLRASSVSTRVDKVIAISICISSFCYVIFSSGSRIFLFQYILSVVGLLIVNKKLSTVNLLIFCLLLPLILFGLTSFILGKGIQDVSTDDKILNQYLDTLQIYTLGGTYALDHLVNNYHFNSFEFGENVFRSFYAFFKRIGVENVNVIEIKQEFIYYPLKTNVYTCFSTYYKDFGIYGIVSFQLLIGLIHGWLYRKIILPRISLFYGLLYAMTLFPLVAQGFMDFYFTSLSFWLQIVLISYFFGRVKFTSETAPFPRWEYHDSERFC